MYPAIVALAASLVLLLPGPASAWRTDLRGRFTELDVVNNGASGVAVDASGDVLAVGNLENFPVSLDFTVVKLSAGLGDEMWRREIRGTRDTGGNAAYAVAVDRGGDVVAVGHLENDETPGTFAIVKLEGATGEVLWRHELGGTAGWGVGFGVTVDDTGDVVAVGTVENVETGNDLTVVKVDGPTGSLLWQRDVTQGFTDSGYALALDATGDVIAAGSVGDFDRAFAVVKLAGSDGTERWRHVIPGPGWAAAVAVDARGDVVAGGAAVEDQPMAVALDGTTGAERWRYALPPALFSSFAAVAFDPHGDVLAAGTRFGPTTTTAEVVKLAASSGAERWRFSEPAAYAAGLAVDARGDVLVGGRSGRFRVLKLLGSTGAGAWHRVVHSIGEGYAQAVANDTAGTAVAVGFTQNLRPGVSDFTIVALDGDTGHDKRCGDGILATGELCDDGNEFPGDGCSATCRTEGCLADIALEDVRIRFGSRHGHALGDRLTVRGALGLPATVRLDPETTGMQVVLTDRGTGRPLLDLSEATAPIPSGGPGSGCDPGWDGWRSGSRMLFVYRNTSDAIDPPRCTNGSAQGLRRVRLLDQRRSVGVVRFEVNAELAHLPLVEGPLALTVVLAAHGATPCGTTVVATDCFAVGKGRMLRCRSR